MRSQNIGKESRKIVGFFRSFFDQKRKPVTEFTKKKFQDRSHVRVICSTCSIMYSTDRGTSVISHHFLIRSSADSWDSRMPSYI